MARARRRLQELIDADMPQAPEGTEATLIVSPSYTQCSHCNGHALTNQETHETLAGFGKTDRKGCGARFTAITTGYRNITDATLREIRPDLPIKKGATMADPEFDELLKHSSLGAVAHVHEDDGARTANPRISWRHDDDHPYLHNVVLIGRVGNIDLFTIAASYIEANRSEAPYSLGRAFGYDLKDHTLHISIDAAKERAERDLTRYLRALGVVFKENAS